MSAPGRTPLEQLRARDRQIGQAAGLRALAELIELDDRISELFDLALNNMGAHLPGDRRADLAYFLSEATSWGRAIPITDEVTGNGFRVVRVAWSEHFQIRLQCDSAAPAESGAAEFATGSHDRGVPG